MPKFREDKNLSTVGRPSPFVVDLGEFDKQKNKTSVSAAVLKEPDKPSKQKRQKINFSFLTKFLKHWQPYFSRLTILAIIQLIWRLIKPFFQLIFSLAYAVGWLTVFSIRFVWLLAAKIRKTIKQFLPSFSFKKQAFIFSPTKKQQTLNQKLKPKTAVRSSLVLADQDNLAAELKADLDYLIKPPRPWWQPIKEYCRKAIKYFSLLVRLACYPGQKAFFFLSKKLAKIKLKIVKKKKTQNLPHQSLSKNFQFFYPAIKQALFFGLIVLILILPFKAYTYYQAVSINLRGQVLGVSEEAVKNIIKAGKQAAGLSLDQAQNNFLAASQNFSQAQALLANINDALFELASFAPSADLRLASQGKILAGVGQKVSLLGHELSAAAECLFLPFSASSFKVASSSFDFRQGVEHIKKANQLSAELDVLLNKISLQALPTNYQPSFDLIKNQARKLNFVLSQFADLADWAYKFLGGEVDKRYLLVFQNNAEARATGGFIGSYALIDVSGGRIKNWEAPAGGSYDTAGGLTEFIASPHPLQLIQPRWYFWDANWWPDWPTSAQQLAWFLEKSDGPSVDGVIAITAPAAEKFLEVIGPIKLGEPYNVEINKDNFWPTVQAFAEQKPPQTSKPKQIIGDILAQILDNLSKQLRNKDKITKLSQAVKECLEEKDILLYLTDKQAEEKIKAWGWGGEILPVSQGQDYLMVVNTNIGGGKSDRAITQTIKHQTEIQADGTIIDTLEITRRHKGSDNPYVNVPNIDWLRVYVPAGSKLLEAGGFLPPDPEQFEAPEKDWQIDPRLLKEDYQAQTHSPDNTKIYTENGKTVFANWSQVQPGQITVVYFKYVLPFKLRPQNKENSLKQEITDSLLGPLPRFYPYSLLVQKQPGAAKTVLIKKTITPKFFSLAWNYPQISQQKLINKHLFVSKQALGKDSFFSYLFSFSP